MFHRARRKLMESALHFTGPVAMIGDTMETDIRGAVEAGLLGFLVLTGSTQLENVCDYVYQPSRILQSVADLTEEILTGKAASHFETTLGAPRSTGGKSGHRHQTDVFAFHKPRPRPAMTK
jgi:NagD protein